MDGEANPLHAERKRVVAPARRLACLLGLMVVLAGCSLPITAPSVSHAGTVFDPASGAPLPNSRIVAAYGIAGGVDYNGPASSLELLGTFYPQLQDLGNQYASLDPSHPVRLAVDLAVNPIQPCRAYPQYCSSWADAATTQAYIQFCKEHDLLLFLDLQLGTEPVKDAVLKHALPYLQKYDFVELALDTEFHFPDTRSGYADAAGYPCCLGWMDAGEVNWAEEELAQISLQNRLPRKVLLLHQWNPAMLPNKEKIHTYPDVSLVLQSDGFGSYTNKVGDYQVFVQQDLLEYGGYKLFFHYDDGSTAYDFDQYGTGQVQTPQEVMQLFPQPLFVSYQ
jgi:hypothetical protein